MLIQIRAKNTFQIAIFSVNVLFLDESTMHFVRQIHIKCKKNKNIDGLLKLEDQEISSTNKILLKKCGFLESLVVDMQRAMICLMCDFLKQNEAVDKKKLSKKKKDRDKNGWSGNSTNQDSRCKHSISISHINKTESCKACKVKYKEKFIDPFPCCKEEKVFKLLQQGHDIASAVKKLK